MKKDKILGIQTSLLVFIMKFKASSRSQYVITDYYIVNNNLPVYTSSKKSCYFSFSSQTISSTATYFNIFHSRPKIVSLLNKSVFFRSMQTIKQENLIRSWVPIDQ